MNFTQIFADFHADFRRFCFYLRYLLIFAFICENLNAQSNQAIYTQFIQQLAKREGTCFLSYNGYSRNIDSLYLEIDTFAQNRLIPQKWEINYSPLPQKNYLRQANLQMHIQTKDTFYLFVAEYKDTLSKSQVKTLLRTETADFQGKTPFWQDIRALYHGWSLG